jgi:hypothetical protein
MQKGNRGKKPPHKTGDLVIIRQNFNFAEYFLFTFQLSTLEKTQILHFWA